MKRNTMIIGAVLIALSILLHALHFVIFQDLHHVLIYLLGDIAFIPLEVFLVTVVLDRLIDQREERERKKKANMLVGLFYQELGNKVLSVFAGADNTFDSEAAKVNFQWDAQSYSALSQKLANHSHTVTMEQIDLKSLFDTIRQSQQLIINLLTNTAIQEHELFSDSLMSLFHLSEELGQRPLDTLSQYDVDHLQVDIKRAYRSLSIGWVEYLSHLQKEYPYLFLSAISNNPFENRRRADVEQEVIQTRG